MKTLLFILGAAMAMAGPGLAEAPKVPAEVRKALHDTAKFHEIRKVAELPPGVLALVTNGGNSMANPGEDWQVTDVVDPGKPLPGRRLIWAASDGTHCVIHWETGGIAHIFHTAVVAPGKEARMVWENSAMPAKRFKDLASFVEAIGVK